MSRLSDGQFACLAIFMILVFTFTIIGVVNKVSVTSEIAEVEQLRKDVAAIDKSGFEIDQVLKTNQKIASAKANNKIFFISWLVPDEWDSVQPIMVR